MKQTKRRALILMLACALNACGSDVPVEPATSISEEDKAYGASQHEHLLTEFGGAYSGKQSDYVGKVGQRIAAGAGLEGQCTFTLVNSDVVNAFAVPGCYIYITRGLLAVVGSEAELASVLGHEIGHIVARHAQRQERRSLWRTLGVIAVSLTGSERLTALAGQAAQFFGLRYSRSQEYEADDLAIAYLRSAGYDVNAAAEMLADLQRQEAFMQASRSGDSARSIPEWALSHPLTSNRISRARDNAKKTGLVDDALPEDRAAYLVQVDGLLYGDDPQQGFVLGRHFAHPIMRISFEAPSGFSLANSPQAVRLSGPDGISGEFGGGRLPRDGLRAYAQDVAEAVVGDTPAQVQNVSTAQINGMPAVILQIAVSVRNGTIPLSIAAYDGGGGEAYHFLLISPPSSPQDAAIRSLFGSFRRLSQSEADALRPRFVRVVRPVASDTVETFVRRTIDPRPRELFELMNGEYKGRRLRTGDPVKIVTY